MVKNKDKDTCHVEHQSMMNFEMLIKYIEKIEKGVGEGFRSIKFDFSNQHKEIKKMIQETSANSVKKVEFEDYKELVEEKIKNIKEGSEIEDNKLNGRITKVEGNISRVVWIILTVVIGGILALIIKTS